MMRFEFSVGYRQAATVIALSLYAATLVAIPSNSLFTIDNPGTLPDAAFSRFGAAAAAGKTIVFVGAPDYDDGAADTGAVFGFNPKTGAFLGHGLFGTDVHVGDHIGSAIAANAKYGVFGAPSATVNTIAGAGDVIVLNFKTNTHFVLALENAVPNAGYGTALGLSNDLLFVGGPKAISQTGVNSAGTVLVFNIKTGPLMLGALIDPDAAPDDGFGSSIAISKKYLAVGAPNRTVSGLAGVGAVVLFDLKTLVYIGTIDNPHLEAGSHFGSTLALGTKVLAVGAPQADRTTDLGFMSDIGRVYQYDVASRGFVRELFPDVPQIEEHFGAAMSTDGKTLVVGTPDEQGGSISEGSTVSFFLQTGQRIRANISAAPVPAGGFGRCVTVLKGGNYLVGAPGEQDGSGNTVGRAYMFKKFTTVGH